MYLLGNTKSNVLILKELIWSIMLWMPKKEFLSTFFVVSVGVMFHLLLLNGCGLFYFLFFWLRGVLELVLGFFLIFHEIGRPKKFSTKIWKTLQEWFETTLWFWLIQKDLINIQLSFSNKWLLCVTMLTSLKENFKKIKLIKSLHDFKILKYWVYLI